MSFTPHYTFTPGLAQLLMDIEASRQAVSALPITARVLQSLRESARLTATHYSTQIEGNRLTEEQVGEVLRGGAFPNRERDEQEVKNYYLALEYLDGLISAGAVEIAEADIMTLHCLVMEGRARPTPYRDGQNVIRDSVSRGIVYMPPEATDVSGLMGDLVDWINEERRKGELPVPIIAAIAHYQFATIHPYYDGNGRTARLLTNLILHKSGYGLKGIYSLEEYYAQSLQDYYDALTIGESHNYYFGREAADITQWVVYFCTGMADAFANVRRKAADVAAQSGVMSDQTSLLRELDLRQRQVLTLFEESRFVTTLEVATLLGLHRRTALNLCKQWVESGFLVQHGTANKTRRYELAEQWFALLS